MMLFGIGLAFFFGKAYIQPTAPRLRSIPLGGWTGNPQLADGAGGQPAVLGRHRAGRVAMAGPSRNTRWGLIVRMTGDSAPAARAMGVSVDLVRFLADRGRRLPRRRRRRLPVALLSRAPGTRGSPRARA